jgi:hypothetical protein
MAGETSPAAPACGNPPTVARANPPSPLAPTNDSGQYSPHATVAVAFIIMVVIVALISPDPAAAGAIAGNAMESIIIFFKA